MVLVATGKDTNNNLVLLAFAICDKENASNYAFLLSEMKKNSHLKELLQSPLTTIYSDEHKGIKAGIRQEAKDVIHRLCFKHLVANLPGPGVGEVCSARAFVGYRVACILLLKTTAVSRNGFPTLELSTGGNEGCVE